MNMSIKYSLSNSEGCYPSYLGSTLTLNPRNKSTYKYAKYISIYIYFANIPQNPKINQSINMLHVNMQISS